MRIEFNRTGEQRKELVSLISAFINEDSKYLGAPSMAYKVGNILVTRDGAMEWDEQDYPIGLDQLLQDLERAGIEPAEAEEKTENSNEEEEDKVSVAMPRDFFTEDGIEKLQKLVESKENLIKKALGADGLPIVITEDKVTFPWFKKADAESMKAYTDFVAALSKMAVTQKRITAKEKEVDNEKYAFRCFLLRLGFIGDEFKSDRKILLSNLSGSSAFKRGQKGGEQA